jgi:hypothetical protein
MLLDEAFLPMERQVEIGLRRVTRGRLAEPGIDLAAKKRFPSNPYRMRQWEALRREVGRQGVGRWSVSDPRGI